MPVARGDLQRRLLEAPPCRFKRQSTLRCQFYRDPRRLSLGGIGTSSIILLYTCCITAHCPRGASNTLWNASRWYLNVSLKRCYPTRQAIRIQSFSDGFMGLACRWRLVPTWWPGIAQFPSTAFESITRPLSPHVSTMNCNLGGRNQGATEIERAVIEFAVQVLFMMIVFLLVYLMS